MPYQSLQMQPGINVEKTPLLNSASWSYSVAVRFRDGLAEKCGGWAHLNPVTLTGICTGLHAWADLGGNPYIAAGTDQALDLFFGGQLFDITPLRLVTDNAPTFSTNAGSPTVNIKDVANGSAVGDIVNIFVPVSVGGLIIQGYYVIDTIVDADNYTITAASNAVTTVADGGAVPVFDTTMSSPDVQVTFADHGLLAGGTFNTQVDTTVGGLAIPASIYSVVAPVTSSTFIIQPGGTASSTATGSENGGNVEIQYLVHSGLPSATYENESGYGLGPYGGGPYGISSTGTVLVPLRQWFLDNFGQDLVGNYTGSPIYLWTPPTAPGNVAIAIDTTNFPTAQAPPQQVVFSFVAAPQQMIIAGGADDPITHVFDPNLVRWCDQSDFTDWLATSLNQAGSYRIPSGSRLVSGISAPNFIVLWTDIDMWLMSYLGGTGLSALVWGFAKVEGSTGLLSARSYGVFENLVFFASSNGVFMFNGNAMTLIPCPVWDKFWKNLNRQQIDKVNMQINSYFQEMSLAFPSASGNGTVDSRITYNIRENSWTYDDAPTLMARTAWIDENVYGSPAGTDLAGYIQQQDGEGVYDADGMPLAASIRTGWFSAQEGTLLSMMERIEADAIVTGGTGTIYLTVYAQDYATGPVRTYGSYPWTIGNGPPWSIVRARGRFLSVQIASQDAGVFWRIGDIRYVIQSAGRRP